MTITEFLLARIAEDEAAAGDLPADGYPTHDHRVLGPLPGDTGPDTRAWNPARVLAESEAKRRIVAAYERYDRRGPVEVEGARRGLSMALRALAVVYADHPDYREEWRP